MPNGKTARYIVKVWDGYTNSSFERIATYDYLANVCRAYPPSYIWSIEPA
jgi:hypothetical protein